MLLNDNIRELDQSGSISMHCWNTFKINSRRKDDIPKEKKDNMIELQNIP